jgi:hypothetical protein
LGVVVAFSPPLAVVGVAVLDDADELEDVEEFELFEDPQPAANRSAEQAITTTGKPLLIGDDPFSADVALSLT